MKIVLLFACYICFVDSIGTFNVSITFENLCLNIYDYSGDQRTTTSQLKMTFYMTSGTTTSQWYMYSSKLYPFVGTNNFIFNIADNILSGSNALPTSLDRISLSPSDIFDLVFLVEPVITSPNWAHPLIKCPDKNHSFVQSIDPLTILTGVNSLSYNQWITVPMTSLDGCDGPGGGGTGTCCSSDEINVLLNFTCSYYCGDLSTTSTASTTMELSTDTSNYTSTSTPQSPSPGFVVTIVIAAVEFIVICIVAYLYLRQRVQPLKQTHPLHVEQIPTVEGSENAIELGDGFENGYMPALGHVAIEGEYYEID